MPSVIHKHCLPPNMTVTELLLTDDIEWLDVQLQGDQPVLWALQHDTGNSKLWEVFGIFTGIKAGIANYEGQYLGTVQCANGLVLHYFVKPGD